MVRGDAHRRHSPERLLRKPGGASLGGVRLGAGDRVRDSSSGASDMYSAIWGGMSICARAKGASSAVAHSTFGRAQGARWA